MEKPERLGIVSSIYKQYTASALTEALMNVYAKGMGKGDKFQSINSFMVEWDIDVNFVKRLKIRAIEGDGSNGSDVIVHFDEHYYEQGDIFVIEDTRQQLYVKYSPVRKSDACFEYVCQIVDSDYNDSIEASVVGMDTRFITNRVPELHETGYVKYQSNIEKHRAFIGTTRCDIDYSAKYRALEDQFINIATKDQDFTFKLTGAEKVCLDSFMLARNQGLLFSKGSMNADGKSTLVDNLGRPVIAPEGLIPQLERFASKFSFNENGFNVRLWEQAMQEMSAKAESAQGNTWTFICNTRMYNLVQRRLSNWIRDWKTTGCFVWSKGTNKYVDLGATYQSYQFAGNTLIFALDRSLDVEFSKKAYGIFVDLTSDSNGTPGLMFFTFKGGQLIHNVITGVGGLTGLASGEVSSPVAGAKIS